MILRGVPAQPVVVTALVLVGRDVEGFTACDEHELEENGAGDVDAAGCSALCEGSVGGTSVRVTSEARTEKKAHNAVHQVFSDGKGLLSILCARSHALPEDGLDKLMLSLDLEHDGQQPSQDGSTVQSRLPVARRGLALNRGSLVHAPNACSRQAAHVARLLRDHLADVIDGHPSDGLGSLEESTARGMRGGSHEVRH